MPCPETGIGIGSNRQGYFLWAFCLFFISPFPCPTHGVCSLPQPDRSFGMIFAANGYRRWLRVTLLTMRSLLYLLLLIIYSSLYLYLVSSLGLRVAHLYHYRSPYASGRPCLLLYTIPAMQCAFWACIYSYGLNFIGDPVSCISLCEEPGTRTQRLAHGDRVWKQR